MPYTAEHAFGCQQGFSWIGTSKHSAEPFLLVLVEEALL